MGRVGAYHLAPFAHGVDGVAFAALRLGVEVERLVHEVVGPQRRQVGQTFQQPDGIFAPVVVERRLDEQHDTESGAVGLLHHAACGAVHGGGVALFAYGVETDAYGIESPGGYGVEMGADIAVAVPWRGYHTVAIDEGLVV